MPKMYSFSVLLSILCYIGSTVAQDVNIDSIWKNYKKNFSLIFTNPTEEANHFRSFRENYLKILAHNKEAERNPSITYKVSLNEFSHLGLADTKRSRFGLRSFKLLNVTTDPDPEFHFGRAAIPDRVDWSSYSAAIKDQRTCGACWAFAVVGVLESLYAIKNNKRFKRLSEQQLIDCTFNDRRYMSYGCDGGWPDNGFEYVKQNGVVEEAIYPYKLKVNRIFF